jgi:5'(3')-deoxyribonucleotidase
MTLRLLLDMDGPMADFDGHFYNECIANGWKVNVESRMHQTERYFTGHMQGADKRKAEKMVRQEGWFRSLPVTEGAQDGVEALLVADFDVWVCSKPMDDVPTCMDEKKAWLTENFPALKHKLIMAPDKTLIMGDFLLDDAPKLEWLTFRSARWWKPIIFTEPYNGDGSPWEHLPHWTWGDPLNIFTR